MKSSRARRTIEPGESAGRRGQVFKPPTAAPRDREHSAQVPPDIERLMGHMREANERLIVAVVRAQRLSDEAHADAVHARTQVAELVIELRVANERLAAGAARAYAMAKEALEREDEYRRLSQRLLNLQDEERRRLARDLHDSTGQRLAALAMSLDLVRKVEKTLDAKSRRALAESRVLAGQCSREVRTLAYLLHPPLLEEIGLLSAVRWFVKGFAKRSGVRVATDLREIGRLPGPIETALFRVVQEALTNVHRHASVVAATLSLVETADVVVLEIHDSGRGRRDQSPPQTGTPPPEALGVGVQGMRERIRQLGGTFDIDFADTGTTVRVRVPIDTDVP